MPNDHIDRRPLKTKRLLDAALIELTLKKGFDSLTVVDLAGYADINRATFYRHYCDKYAMLTSKFTSGTCSWKLEGLPWGNGAVSDRSFSLDGLEPTLDYIASHDQFYRALLGRRGSPWFQHWLRDYWLDGARTSMIQLGGGELCPLTIESNASFAVHALQGMIVWWLESENPWSSRTFAERYCNMLLVGIPEASIHPSQTAPLPGFSLR